MDIEEKTIIRKEKKKMIANKLKIPQKEYPLFQERQIQFVDQQRPGMKNKQDKKEREREEF